MKTEEIDKARRLLGLGIDATLDEVKEAYRELAKKHHPDRNGSAENFTRIHEAYDILTEYMHGYRYSFSAGEVKKQYPEELWKEIYQNDPTWGRGGMKRRSKNESRSSY